MTIEEKAQVIRLMATGIVISQYALLRLKDNTKFELKQRVNTAIAKCQDVEKWFIHHTGSDPETSALFKKQFNSNEILMLSSLLETCFVLDEDGIGEVIKAVQQAIELEQQPVNS
jgi:hypothetical protein